MARTNAEIRRLKALHPNWTPPTNIYSAAGSGNDEQPFWDLLADDRLDELHAGIALRMKSEPGWRPSRDLTTKIARKEAILALTAGFRQEELGRAFSRSPTPIPRCCTAPIWTPTGASPMRSSSRNAGARVRDLSRDHRKLLQP